MFRPNYLYRHRRCLDIDIYVVKIQYASSDYIKLRIKYINRFNGIDYGNQSVTIFKKEYKNWKRL